MEKAEVMKPEWPYAVAAGVVVAVWLIGSSGNAVALLTFLQNRGLLAQQPVFLLLLNLSISTPMMFISAISKCWIFGPALCDIYAFGMSIAGITNACTIAVIAVQRYRIVKRTVILPRNRGAILSLQLSKGSNGSSQGSVRLGNQKPPPGMLIAMLIIWAYATGVSLPPLLGWSDFIVEGIGFSCAPRWTTLAGGDFRVVSYSVFLMFFAFVLPCLIVIVCYALLVRHVKTSNMTGQKTFDQRVIHLQRLTGTMILVFLSSWLPYATLSFLVMLGFEDHIPLWLASLPVICCKISTAINPFVYYLTVEKLRAAMRKALTRLFCCGRKRQSKISKLPRITLATASTILPPEGNTERQLFVSGADTFETDSRLINHTVDGLTLPDITADNRRSTVAFVHTADGPSKTLDMSPPGNVLTSDKIFDFTVNNANIAEKILPGLTPAPTVSPVPVAAGLGVCVCRVILTTILTPHNSQTCDDCVGASRAGSRRRRSSSQRRRRKKQQMLLATSHSAKLCQEKTNAAPFKIIYGFDKVDDNVNDECLKLLAPPEGRAGQATQKTNVVLNLTCSLSRDELHISSSMSRLPCQPAWV